MERYDLRGLSGLSVALAEFQSQVLIQWFTHWDANLLSRDMDSIVSVGFLVLSNSVLGDEMSRLLLPFLLMAVLFHSDKLSVITI